ncbi:hypothetical protein [Flectobacillus sp. BAB-3569]|uniref:hypothetical protein n=1 Tax=Flectobacillus sp. BAB-3569 TaxID=1509483 RepID=UPI000BA3CFEB|nr:hypothetical protein [Flectobacillus sp. BAB-3569]PAC27813.1 hypothetical protein BWI92_21615 [Flectobacillus sp. BAB-3569]
MKNILEEIIKLSSELGAKKNLEKYKELADKIEIPKNYGVFDFDRCFLNPLRKFAEVLIKVKISENPDVVEIIMNHQYYVRHFEHWIQRIEGSAFCHDRSTMLVDMLIAYYRKKQPMVFDYECKLSFCYPKTIFNTQQKVVEFYESVKQLRYGHSYNYIVYIEPMIDMVIQANPKNKS